MPYPQFDQRRMSCSTRKRVHLSTWRLHTHGRHIPGQMSGKTLVSRPPCAIVSCAKRKRAFFRALPSLGCPGDGFPAGHYASYISILDLLPKSHRIKIIHNPDGLALTHIRKRLHSRGRGRAWGTSASGEKHTKFRIHAPAGGEQSSRLMLDTLVAPSYHTRVGSPIQAEGRRKNGAIGTCPS